MATPSPIKASRPFQTKGPGLGWGVGLDLLRVWHLTSLDAPTVAVVWTLGFAWAARVRLPLWVLVILALGSWSVYIGDRLLDARSGRGPLRDRHHFNWRHRHLLSPVAIGALCVAIALSWHYVPVSARARNSVLAGAALLYFAGVHSRWRLAAVLQLPRIPKEAQVGSLFTVACVMPVWARCPGYCLELLLPAVGYVLLAWLNCHAIERWEDTGQDPTSFWVAKALAVGSLLASVAFEVFRHPRPAALLAAAASSAVMLALLDRVGPRIAPVTLRAAADLVLLAPLALIGMQ